MEGKKWIKKEPKIEYFDFENIHTKLSYINGINDIKEWLTPSIKSIYTPYLLKNIKKASNRIIKAIKNKESIGVFFDNDCDGLTSGSIMTRYLKNFTDNIVPIYQQRQEGHGIEHSIDKVTDEIKLLIIVDSSTNSIEACKQISEKNIDTIILDHHMQEEKNPYAIIVNNQIDNYPNKELSGAGIVYKTIQVLDDKLREDKSLQYIDLVGLGICGDVMSVLEPENRYLISQSLKNITNPGLKALLYAASAVDINSQTYSFTIVPMINACARMNRIEIVIDLLLSDNEKECKKLAKECKKYNEDRKTLQFNIFNKVKANNQINENEKIIIVVTEESNKGFNGLIAADIAEKYQRPCLVVKNNDGICTGSGRTYEDFNLKGFLEKSNLFNMLQGHLGSFGIEFNFDKLQEIQKYIEENIEDNQFTQNNTYYDLEIDVDEITRGFIEEVQIFNFITGKDFQQTRFLIKDFKVCETSIIGKRQDTLKIIREDGLTVLKFKCSDKEKDKGMFVDKIDLIGNLNINKFYHWGKRDWIISNQILIEDFKTETEE